jgi:uncharacterized protein YyaL (SSP411 family)
MERMSLTLCLTLSALARSPLAASPLALEPSPFYRQRSADQAVWEAWNPDVFARAAREGRLVLLAVGRAACLRCDALAAVGRVEAPGFVPVLADADERPDVAELAAQAVVLLHEGEIAPRLPLVLALTPEARPLGAWSLGRAFSEERLAPLLDRVATDWRERRAESETLAGLTAARLRAAQTPTAQAGAPARDAAARALRGLREGFDGTGFDPPPRGLPHAALRFLLHEHARSGNAEALRLASAVLTAVAESPMRHSSRAFHAEAGEAEWRLPRPGIVLADNALLLRAFVLAYEATGQALLRQAAAGIADWIAGEAPDEAGGLRAGLLDGGEWDERVFAGASGLALSALAASGTRLGRPRDLDAARRAASDVLDRLGPPAALRRFAWKGEARGPAFLDDHAFLAEGLILLHEADPQPRWLAAAVAVAEAALRRHHDPATGGLFENAEDETLVPRLRAGYDGARPSASGVLADVLRRLAAATGEARYAVLGRGVVDSYAGELALTPRAMATLADAEAALFEPGPAAADPSHVPRLVWARLSRR